MERIEASIHLVGEVRSLVEADFALMEMYEMQTD